MGILRQRAKEFGLQPDRLGVLGFSAGGNLAALLSNNYTTRTYPTTDSADSVSCRPDFAVLIYPAYLVVKEEGNKVSPLMPLTAQTPPTFLAMSADDRVGPENVLFYAAALKELEVPVEVHLYPIGGHGYGLRRTDNPVTTWPDRVADWMKASGWLTRP